MDGPPELAHETLKSLTQRLHEGLAAHSWPGCPDHSFPVAPVPAGCGLCSRPVSPLDGAATIEHHRGTAVQPDPDPAAELGVQPALGSPRGPFPASWQDGPKLRDTARLVSPARGSAPGTCGAASLRQPWARWH